MTEDKATLRRKSEELKMKFLPLIGKDYESVACRRMNLPTMRIQDWLRGHNVLPEYLQVRVQEEIAKHEATKKLALTSAGR